MDAGVFSGKRSLFYYDRRTICTSQRVSRLEKEDPRSAVNNIKIENIDVLKEPNPVNQTISVKARIDSALLTPDDLQVELYTGLVNANGDIVNGVPTAMEYQGQDPQSRTSIYTSNITYTSSGLQGMSLRILPKHEYLSSSYELGLILWAQ